jgi:hypothetical protein
MIRKLFKYKGEKIMFRKFYTTILLLLITFSFSLAQSGTGRISGKVIDKQTGEALIGANVIVEGTTFGAATDVNGEYLISQVPSGTYSVRASYIGFQSSKVTNVRIKSGLTTNINFTLASTEFSTEELVVVAKKPLIEKSSTNARRIIGAEDIEALPTRSLAAIVALQPGVVRLNGDTFIRGSRADETGYTVEGADVKNILSRDGGSLVSVTPDAVQELVIQAGGYTAQYGNANAGIVSQDFKTGTDQYHASFRGETDDFGNFPGETFLDTYSYGYSDLVATFGGPVFTNKLKIFISGERRKMGDRTPTFFYDNPTAFSDGALFDTTKIYDTGVRGGDKNEYQILDWQPGNFINRGNERYTLNSTLLFDSNPFIVRLSAALTHYESRGGGMNIINMFNNDRASQYESSNLLLNLKTTYLVTANSYFTAKVNFFDGRTKNNDPIFGDNYLEYSDSLANAKQGYQFQNYITGPATYDFYGFPFAREGAPRAGFSKNHNNYLGGSIAYTAQIDKHSIKTGASYQRWTVRHYGLDGAGSNFLSTLRNNPDLTANKDSMAFLIGNKLYRSVGNYGYDVFGNTVDEGVFDARHPVLASAYIEDRFEINDIILNLGFRYDFINMDSWKWKNPGLPGIDEKTNLPKKGELLEGSTYGFVSPRLGFSFPVSDKTVFHLQYGKFVQSPSLDVAFRGIYRAAEIMQASNLITNPIAYDPKPLRTTSYEIGFAHQLSDFAALDITAFYKDIKGQLQYTNIQTDPGAPKAKYAAFTNQDFSTSQGVEVSLRLRRVERVAAQINYTYADAEGTNSFVGSGIGSVEANNEVPTVILPLNYNFTHSGNISVDYRFGVDDGGSILERFGANLLLTFNSGHPYTLARDLGLGQNSAWTGGLIPFRDTRGRRPIGPVNSSTTPWQFNLDLRVDKTVSISDFDVNFYVYVTNLLNTKNVINVYQKTGNAYDDGFLQSSDGKSIISKERYTERFADLYRALNLGNRQSAFANYGYDLFSAPRQIRVGVKVNF